MSFTIRQATNQDVDGVVQVIRSVYEEYNFTWEEGGYHADLYDIEAHYDADGGRFYVAEMDGVIVGTVALGRFDPVPGPIGELVSLEGFTRVAGCDCDLNRLYVDASARRLGVGHGLMRHVVVKAQAAHRTAMEIWSDKRFVDAHRLYERFGAKVVGGRICHDPDHSPEWGLVVPLTPQRGRSI